MLGFPQFAPFFRWAQTIGHESTRGSQSPVPNQMSNTHTCQPSSNRISSLIGLDNGVDNRVETRAILSYILINELGTCTVTCTVTWSRLLVELKIPFDVGFVVVLELTCSSYIKKIWNLRLILTIIRCEINTALTVLKLIRYPTPIQIPFLLTPVSANINECGLFILNLFKSAGSDFEGSDKLVVMANSAPPCATSIYSEILKIPSG